MDNIKSIELLHKFFQGQADTVEKLAATEIPQARRKLYFTLRKMVEKYLEFYDDNYAKENFNYASEKASNRVKVPLVEKSGLKDVKEYEDGMMGILKSFYSIGSYPERVRDFLEGALDKIKYGWYRKLEELKEKT